MAVREEKKQRTRSALLDAALAVMSRSGGFGALGLREVTREAGVVPTAFYRHFKDMDELGLALVEEGCITLRQMLRAVRVEAAGAEDLAIRRSVETFFAFADEHATILEFVVRERSGPSLALRAAIARELRSFAQELANDLRLFAPLRDHRYEDLETIGELIVHAVTAHLVELLLPADGVITRDAIIAERMEKQLRIILLGATMWRSKGTATGREDSGSGEKTPGESA